MADPETTYAAWIDSMTPSEREQAEALGVATYDEPSYSGNTVENWQLDAIRAAGIDADELTLDLLQCGIEEHRIPDVLEIFEHHAGTLAAEALRRMVQHWQDSKVPRVAGLLRALGLHQGETIRSQAERCDCAPSTISEHERRFREAQ